MSNVTSQSQLLGIHHDLLRSAIETAAIDIIGEGEAFCRAELAKFAERNGLAIEEDTVAITTIYRRWDPEVEWTDAEGETQKGGWFPATEVDYTDLRLMLKAYANPRKVEG